MQKAVFLDKDGTLVSDVPYNVNPSLIKLERGVLEGLSALQSSGYLLVIVSNQPGISMDIFSVDELETLILHMKNLFAANKIDIAGFYYCPHYPIKTEDKNASHCSCRKPASGLLTKAAEDLNIDLNKSWMIGDILNDVEAGFGAGCRTVLINNGNETEWEINCNRIPDYIADDFLDASNYIFIKTMIKNV